MKNKSTIIMGAVFLVLVVIYFLTSYKPPEVTSGAEPLFGNTAPDIDRIEMTQPNGIHMVLARRDGTWHMDAPFQYKADDQYVNMLITEIEDVMIDGVISDREDAQVQYGVTDSASVNLKVMSGDTTLFDGFVGNRSQELGHSYARRRGSNEIELWRGMLSQEVRRDANDWRDRTVYRINRDDIIRIAVTEGASERVLSFADTVWVFTEGGVENPIDSRLVRQAAAMLAELKCDDFANENDITTIIDRDPDISVTFTVRNGDTNTYKLWRPVGDSTRYLMRKEGGDVLYRIYGSRGQVLAFQYDDFKLLES